ncbi:MAG: PadR family transcriptional regulator [bacterium]|jgi:DNA-binding PadR family transcriptional regulator|nr:PadR family transcriptional regulator [bacterium]
MGRKQSARTPLGLAILDFLAERPMHPYEMRQLIRERHLDDHVKVRGGSLYHAVERLVADGLIEPVETERQGRRPERTVYAITEAGRDEFTDWLDEALQNVQKEYTRFGGALAFMHNRDPETVRTLLWQRSTQLAAEIAAHDEVQRRLQERELPRAFVIEDEYAQILRRAELDFVNSLVEDIRSGALRWPPHLPGNPKEESS